ncbi:MAG: dephospho-CoA kinase [Clostridiales bacterium]|jgi:dephospho-CoA kinase|nr:dephospho-CoA kinase [Clostridiales bacterium]
MQDKFVVGITGGIASGKTVLSTCLSERGAYIIDADLISRDVIRLPEVQAAIKAAFPTVFWPGGDVDRTALRAVVFDDEGKRLRLNEIMHPAILTEIRKKIDEAPQKLVYIVVPLLFEAGYDTLCHYIVTIVADEQKRISRLLNRDTISEELAVKIMRAQISESERITGANEVIVNNDTPEAFARRAEELHEKMLEMAK